MSVVEPVSVVGAVPAVVVEISEPLTWAEICARYPDEWVCLVEIDRLHRYGFEFRTARVVGHGKTRGEPVAQVLSSRRHYDLVGHYYTGRIIERSPRPRFVRDGEDWVLVGFRPMLVADDES